MGGRKSTSKSLFCAFFSCSGRKSSYGDEEDWDPRYMRRIRPSDEDRGLWVGDPYVDKKASDFIAKFHEARYTDPERQAIAV